MTLVMCVISYFYVVVIKYPNQGNLLEKEFTQVYKSKGVRAIMDRSMEKKWQTWQPEQEA